jgi:uncharacterized protein (TIGR04255 family)
MPVVPVVHPKFNEPPLVEQAIVVAFDAVQGFELSDYGLFWREIREDFPLTETASRLETAVESFDQNMMLETSITFMPMAMPRAFYRNSTGGLVQLQNDRLGYNWVKNDANEYPHFESTRATFNELFEKLVSYCRTRDLPELKIRQCEVTNLNIIPVKDFGDSFADIGKAFVVDPLDMKVPFLINETYTRARQHRIVDDSHQAIGRLHSVITPVFDPVKSIAAFKFELTARSGPTLDTIKKANAFLDSARSALNAAFLATTTSKMRSKWREQND